MDIPRLKQRLDAFLYKRTFTEHMTRLLEVLFKPSSAYECFTRARGLEYALPGMIRFYGISFIFFSSQRAKLAFLGVSELKTSKRWLTILEIVLTIGNTLNEGTVFGNAGGFRIDSLLKV
jgi:hypothetical protein